MTTPANFWTKIAPGYATSPIRNVPNYHDTLDRTRAHLAATDHLLELGCGTGPTALSLSENVAQVTATDFAIGMIDIARDRAVKAGRPNVAFDCLSIPQSCALGPFDTIAAFNLLHLIKDLDQTLAEIYGALKPGGTFISKSTCLGIVSPVMWPPIKVMQAMGKAPYVRFMSLRGLKSSMSHAGFEIIDSHIYGRVMPNAFLVARKPV